MGIVVQKYGGSSVADATGIKRVAQRIVATRKHHADRIGNGVCCGKDFRLGGICRYKGDQALQQILCRRLVEQWDSGRGHHCHALVEMEFSMSWTRASTFASPCEE